MLDKSARIFMTMLKNYNNGSATDVFDLMYEHSLPYSALKAVLDGLVYDGVAAMRDLKTYELIGDVKANADRILTGGQPFGALGEARARLVSALDGVRKVREEKGEGTDYFNRTVRRFRRFCNVVETDGEDEDDEDVKNFLFDDDDDVYEDDDADEDSDEDDEDDDYDEDEDSDEEDLGVALDFKSAATGSECVDKAEAFFSLRRSCYSDDFCKVIDKAYNIVSEHNHSYIASEHLVYAMLNCDCGAREVLLSAGANVKTFGERLFQVYDKRLWAVGFTPRTKYFMDRALLLANDIGGEGIKARSEHLLLAMFTQQDCLAVSILKVLSVDMEKLSDELDKALKALGE